MMWNLKAKN